MNRYGGGDLIGLAEAVAYDAVFVTYHHNGREGEGTTALGHLGNALYAHEPVFKLDIARSYFLYVAI